MSLRRALFFSYLEKYGSYVIGLVSTMIISRILGPADIGAFSVGMALVGIVAVLRELGLNTYVVQEAELTSARIRAAFTLTVGMGFVLSLVVLALSGPAGVFYNRALVYSKRGEYDLAIADLTEAIRLNPSDVDSWNRRSAAYRQLGDEAQDCELISLAVSRGNL